MWITNNLWVIIYMLAIYNLYSPLLLLLFSCSPELPILWRIKMVAVDLVALLLTLKEMFINSAGEILAVFLYQHKGFIISSQFNRSLLLFYHQLMLHFIKCFSWDYLNGHIFISFHQCGGLHWQIFLMLNLFGSLG